MPLIVVSADAVRLQQLARELEDQGFSTLAKPFDLQVLVDLVRRTLLQAGPTRTRLA